MNGDRFKESKRYVLLGLGMLLAGSALLLVSTLPMAEGASSVIAFSGGAALLLGNGCIIYGLLIFCDNRRP